MTQEDENKVASQLDGLRAEATAMLEALTPRQNEIMELKSQRPTPSNKEIARMVEGEISESMVEKHLTGARRKMSAETIAEAVTEYIMARTLVGNPMSGPPDLDLADKILAKAVSATPADTQPEFFTSPEFKEFMTAVRGSGPKAWDAKYGRPWRFVAIILIALATLVMVGSTLNVRNALNEVHSEQPS